MLVDASMKEDVPPISLHKARVDGAREEKMGGIGSTQTQAPIAVVRLMARRLAGRTRVRGGTRSETPTGELDQRPQGVMVVLKGVRLL